MLVKSEYKISLYSLFIQLNATTLPSPLHMQTCKETAGMKHTHTPLGVIILCAPISVSHDDSYTLIIDTIRKLLQLGTKTKQKENRVMRAGFFLRELLCIPSESLLPCRGPNNKECKIIIICFRETRFECKITPFRESFIRGPNNKECKIIIICFRETRFECKITPIREFL